MPLPTMLAVSLYPSHSALVFFPLAYLSTSHNLTLPLLTFQLAGKIF